MCFCVLNIIRKYLTTGGKKDCKNESKSDKSLGENMVKFHPKNIVNC